MRSTLRFAILLFFIILLISNVGSAIAQSYPDKPVRLLVGYAPGGGTDILARLIAQKLTESWGQQVIVENRPGANAIIAWDICAKAQPDGYTLAMCATPTTTNLSLYSKLPYDTLKDFTYVTQVTIAPIILVVHPSVQAKSVKELIALAKSKPGQLTFGSSGLGGSLHLAGELFKIMAGIDMVHIPYKGLAPALTDLLGGQLSMVFSDITAGLPHVKGGKLRCLAVTTLKRSKELPDVPTIAESGLPGYEVPVWYGVCGPSGIPKEIVTKINTEIVKVLHMPDLKERLNKLGAEPVGSKQEEFEAFINKEIVKWAKVIKDLGIRLD
jgi:tripartite-type tricarboxylate transporter receptor subunit TctC